MPFDGFPGGLDLPQEGLRAPHPGAGWPGLPDLSDTAWLRLTPDLPARLEREAARNPGPVALGPVALGAEADPYAPVERTMALTRQVLEALERAGRPVTIITRGVAVLRDRDILARLARRGLVRVCVAIATQDAALARRLEPRAASPALRLATIRALAEAGIPACVLVAPVIAGLNDMEPERILAAGAAAGATWAGLVPVHLPAEVRPAVEAWVRAELPNRAARVLAQVREVRATARPGSTLIERFHAATARLGLNRPAADRRSPEARQRQPEPALAAA